MLEFRLRQRVIKVVRHGDPRQLTKGSPHGFHRLKSCDGSAVAGDGDRNTGAFNFGKQRIEPVLGLSAGDRGGGRHICIVYQLGLVALVALARLLVTRRIRLRRIPPVVVAGAQGLIPLNRATFRISSITTRFRRAVWNAAWFGGLLSADPVDLDAAVVTSRGARSFFPLHSSAPGRRGRE